MGFTTIAPELLCLLVLALWSIPINHLPALARVTKGGIEWGLSNRDEMPEVPAWVGRADRAQQNHHDNLAAIATVIGIAIATNSTDDVTEIAAIVILAMRILHAVFYIVGIPVLRSLCYFIYLLGLAAFAWKIVF